MTACAIANPNQRSETCLILAKMISVLIPTKNEEQDLTGCLESVGWSDDVHVYDSGSTDATEAVATRAGARFVVKPRDGGVEVFGGNEAEHKNWALANLPFKHSWVFHLDADERVTPELAASMQQVVQIPGNNVAFRVRRRDFWGNCWLKHVQTSPYYVRLFRPDKMRFERVVNPISIADGPVGELAGHLDHYPFSKGMTHWLSRHNSYSSLEAQQIVANRAANLPFSLGQALFGKDRNQSRFHQKELFYRMPARPLLKFLLLYVGKRGFLDGRAGFHYAMLQSFYEYMIVLKTRELAGKDTVPIAIKPTTNAAAAGAGRNASRLENLHANTRTRD
jgi:glycosyltransferase involved in cell wall biosynthesis